MWVVVVDVSSMVAKCWKAKLLDDPNVYYIYTNRGYNVFGLWPRKHNNHKTIHIKHNENRLAFALSKKHNVFRGALHNSSLLDINEDSFSKTKWRTEAMHFAYKIHSRFSFSRQCI